MMALRHVQKHQSDDHNRIDRDPWNIGDRTFVGHDFPLRTRRHSLTRFLPTTVVRLRREAGQVSRPATSWEQSPDRDWRDGSDLARVRPAMVAPEKC
jgi:hypothetical protein